MKKKEFYTTSEVAKILHVAVGSVINWVDNGQINAIVTPGGHRKIPYRDLINFLEQHNYDIPSELTVKKLVYLIDDKDDIHNFFFQLFRNISGYELKGFYSGTEALLSMGQQPPEIIIVDILMPDIDGIHVIKNIRGSKNLKNVHIIAISADSNQKETALDAGANDFLTKPFSIKDFREAMEKAGG
jgi:excisionase family DNA binding protein